MLVRPRGFPHPVLSPFSDDIVGAAFQVTVVVAGTKNAYAMKVTAKTSNGDLRELIASGAAQYAIHLECSLTRYRALFASSKETYEFEVPAALIDGRVEVCSFILATDEIPKYANSGFHPDYQERTFRVRPGDVLAVGVDQNFIAEKKTDPLRQIPSIFVVVPNEADDAPAMEIESTGHKIRVSLPRQSFDTYGYLKQAQPLHTTLNSMIIVPALIATLEEIKSAAGAGPEGLLEYESRRWYATLRRRLKELRVDPADPDSFKESTPALAHRVVGEPLAPALTSLRGYDEEDDNLDG